MSADPPLVPGVYRLLDPPEAIAAALRAAGWTAVVIPPARRMSQFYASLADQLGLPAYFGANLDALWDCLTDLDQPTALILHRWTDLARARPGRWSALLGVFFERAEQSPPFLVCLA